MLTMLVEIEPHFRRSGQQQLLFETLLVRFALLDRTVGLEEILRGLDGAGSSGSSSSGGGGSGRRETPAIVSAPRLSSPPVMSDSKRISEPAAPAKSVAKPKTVDADMPAVADKAPARKKKQPLDLNHLAEHWEDIVEQVRSGGRGMVASALNEATPSAVTAGGLVTIGVTSDALADALQNGSEAILAALQSIFDGVDKIAVKAMTEGQGAARPRLTAENVIADRVATLRKRDPLLNAAIDALDLRLIE